MSYGETKGFLDRHTRVVELANDAGARVAVCPEWVGRVMTSTCGPANDGPSFGFVNRPFIEAGNSDAKFNNYGGEERMWLSPEGGQFSLWFKSGVAQTVENWFTPAALNEGAWEVVDQSDGVCRMATRMTLENTSETQFTLDVGRAVRLLEEDDVGQLFGTIAASTLSTDTVHWVGYETANEITNRGKPFSEAGGLVSIWILGMLNASPDTVVIVPYKSGNDATLGPVVKSDYFGDVPAHRLKETPEAVLFKGDAGYRSKIGISQRRAKNVLGSIDFAAGVLTLVHFTMPKDPSTHRYMNNMWQLPLAEPYVGDVANSYNDGPAVPGEGAMGAFYEIESLSPAEILDTNETLSHHHRTIHVQAPADILAALAKNMLGVDLSAVRSEMD